VSFDFNVSYSSCWGYSLINTLKLKKIARFLVSKIGPATGVTAANWVSFDFNVSYSSLLIRWPINRSNRFSDFFRLDRLDRFGKIIKSIFPKFWKREFQFSRKSRISSDSWSFGKNIFFGTYSEFPICIVSVVVAYSLTSTDVDHEVLGSRLTIVSRNSHKLDNR